MAPTNIAEYMRLHPDADIKKVRQANGINPEDDMNDYRILTDIKPPTDYYIQNGYPMLDVVNIAKNEEHKRTQNQQSVPETTDPAIKATKERNDIAKLWNNGQYFDAVARVFQFKWF